MKKLIRVQLITVIVLLSATVFSQSLFLVQLTTNANRPVLSQDEVNQIQKEHLGHIRMLNNQGILLAAGPFEGGGGLFILQANSIADAKSAIATDPAVKANRFVVGVEPYTPSKGFICQVHDDAELIMLGFVKISPLPGREQDFQIQKLHREFMAKKASNINIVYEGWNTSLADGFFVCSGQNTESLETLFATHPLVKNGSITVDIKSLWIADGAFCD
jgi:uncharacterized protein YciI